MSMDRHFRTPVKRVAAGLLLDGRGNALVGHRAASRMDDRLRDRDELPQGKFEPNENAFECLVREMREELGVNVMPFATVGVFQLGADKQFGSEAPARRVVELTVVAAVLREGSEPRLDPAVHDRIDFVRLNELRHTAEWCPDYGPVLRACVSFGRFAHFSGMVEHALQQAAVADEQDRRLSGLQQVHRLAGVGPGQATSAAIEHSVSSTHQAVPTRRSHLHVPSPAALLRSA